MIYFDDVKVPIGSGCSCYRDTDMCRAQFHDTPGHAYQNYQAQIRLSVKIKFLVGLARRLTEAIGTTNMPSVREQLGSAGRAGRHGRGDDGTGWRPPESNVRRMVGAEQALACIPRRC